MAAVQLDGDVLTVRMDGISTGWEQWFLLTSDAHLDNPHCDRKLFGKHLAQAAERNAPLFSFGDLFCAMQGKYDPRSSKENLRPEHQTANYLDALVDTAADYIEANYLTRDKNDPDQWAVFAEGNHESAIAARHETNLTKRLTDKLKDRGHDAYAMGYGGFVRFMFRATGAGRSSKVLYFHHGSGGGGPVTKGVIRSNRQAVYLPDAHIVIGGHVHEQWMLTQPRVRLSASGKWYLDDQYHLCSATYKQEFDLHGGFHVERGRPPKPLGGWWLRFYYDPQKHGNIGMEFTLAN